MIGCPAHLTSSAASLAHELAEAVHLHAVSGQQGFAYEVDCHGNNL